MLQTLLEIQGSIREAIGGNIASFAEHRDWFALMLVLPFGIVFGAAHALTPGHSKSVIAAYAVGESVGPRRALMTSAVLAVCHVGTAVLLAFVFTSLVRRTLVGAGQAPSLEWTSRIMLLGIGLWLLVRAVWRPIHSHREGNAIGVAAGLVPCPLTLFIMTYALSLGVPEAGFVFALAMLIGVLVVLSGTALAVVFFRTALIRWMDRHGRSWAAASRWLDLTAAVLLIGIAAYELAA
jgi:nickel/cobalt exporter